VERDMGNLERERTWSVLVEIHCSYICLEKLAVYTYCLGHPAVKQDSECTHAV